MLGHIKAILMQNIQSWKGDEDKQMLVFDEDKLNVIIGRNESGKSVLAKVFRQMCFANFYGTKGRRSLLRRGCSQGLVTFRLYNGTVIHFILAPTYQMYKMKREQDTEYMTWRQNNLPEEIREELGWFIDTENNILLNLIDGEQYMPFIDSPHRFNAGVLKFITEDPDLETVIYNTRESIQTLEVLAVQELQTLNSVKNRESMLRFIDTDTIQSRINKREKIIEVFNPIYSSMCELAELRNHKAPSKPTALNNDKVLTVLIPQFTTVSESTQALKQHLSIPKPKPFHNPPNLTTVISSFKEVRALADQTSDSLSITINRKDFSQSDTLATITSTYKTLMWLRRELNEVRIHNTNIDKLTSDLAEVHHKIHKYKEENKICPLCGGGFSHE